MIFSEPLLAKVLSGEKTVTRRPVKYKMVCSTEEWTAEDVALPCKYEVGKDYAVQPGRGQKAVGRIEVTDVRREPLGICFDGGFPEAKREGFQNLNDFYHYWRGLYGYFHSSQLVDRIEFRLLEGEK